MATTRVETTHDEGAWLINQICTSKRPEQAKQTIYRLLRKPIGLCLASIPPPFPALACGVGWACTSGLAAAAGCLSLSGGGGCEMGCKCTHCLFGCGSCYGLGFGLTHMVFIQLLGSHQLVASRAVDMQCYPTPSDGDSMEIPQSLFT